jgi:anti-anti-sigma factor
VRPWSWVDPEPPSGSYEVVPEDDGPVLHLVGEVDAPVVERIQAGGVRPAEVVAVDVGALTYIDSTGLAMLVAWARHAAEAGRPAVIRRPTARFDQVLDVAGIAPLFVCDRGGTAVP